MTCSATAASCAQGGDWGAAITSRLGYAYPDRLIGIHINLMMAAATAMPRPFPIRTRKRSVISAISRTGSARRTVTSGSRAPARRRWPSASAIHPLALRHGSWRQFRAWSDCGGHVESAIGRDSMLADIALYWFTGAIGSSFLAVLCAPSRRGNPARRRDHLGAHRLRAIPARNPLRPPRSAAARVFTDIRRWSVMPKGGHFAALEQPALLADEVARLLPGIALTRIFETTARSDHPARRRIFSALRVT